LAVEQIVKLASNENPLGMSPKAQAAVLAAIDRPGALPG
jgi:histidinol-phosphate aminotransferase